MIKGKRRVFVEKYLQCWSPGEAAEFANFKHPRQQGSRLLTDVNIQAEIKRRIAEIAMDADEVLLRWAAMARGNIGPYLDFITTGNEAFLEDVDLDLIKKMKVTKKGEVTLELYDSQTALIQLGKHLGLADKTITLKLEQQADEMLALLEELEPEAYKRVCIALGSKDD